MNAPRTLPGFGDEATWSGCVAHPMDPRAPEADDLHEECQDALEEIRLWIGIADAALQHDDLTGFRAAMQNAQEFLSEMEFGGTA